MRHEMSLRGGIFNGAVNLFDANCRMCCLRWCGRDCARVR